MDDLEGFAAREAAPESAFEFTGHWREYLPIAVTNLLLTLVTLGIYRFWARARERRYLWSRTRFIDDPLEWTGTGKEMFLGFLLVMAVLLPAFFLYQFALQALVLRGQVAAAGVLIALLYFGFFYLVGAAQFRALRYRLSRTWWHGIRGGSEEGGWSYGVKHVWKTIVGFLAAGLMVPWSMTSLWNDRWNRMSFGQQFFRADAELGNLIVRWLAVFLVPFGAMLLMMLLGVAFAFSAGRDAPPQGAGFIVAIAAAVLSFYLVFLIATVSYYAAFYRQVVDATSWGGIQFRFSARTKDWLKLILGSIGLVIVTLGFGIMFLGYRNWSFAVRHLEATGEVNLDTLLQSTAAAPTDAEGLASAFDIGAV